MIIPVLFYLSVMNYWQFSPINSSPLPPPPLFLFDNLDFQRNKNLRAKSGVMFFLYLGNSHDFIIYVFIPDQRLNDCLFFMSSNVTS